MFRENKYIKRSHLSEAKFRVIIYYFTHDLPASKIAELSHVYSSNTNISVFHSADEFEIVRQQRTQFALVFARISEKFLTSGFEFGERFVVSVIQGFLLEEFPEAFDQIQIRRIGREEYELDA